MSLLSEDLVSIIIQYKGVFIDIILLTIGKKSLILILIYS